MLQLHDDYRQTWELGTLQRGLVDNCFEEGQYETAIATLEQLRSSEFKPWPPHIRQLVYISLQPISELTITEDEEDTSIQASPSKIVKQHQHRMSLNPIPPKAVVNAQRLLMAYLNTNTPDVLLRPLPRRRSPLSLVHGHTEGDSTVAKRALCIMQAKDCWELLHSEFLSRQSVVLSTPKAKTRYSERIGYGHTGTLDSETVPPMAVTEQAWPLLEWLISLFERDEGLKYADAQARYSPLLADQILDDNNTAHFDAPVAIIVHCLTQQQQQQRQRLASRLLSLLVNLTSTTEVDLQALILAFYTRAHSVNSMSQLISQLNQPTAIQTLKFKIGICQKFIGGLGLPATGGAPRPQPRMRGRPAKAANKEPVIMDTLSTTKPIPVASEIFRLFQTPQPEPDFNGSSSRSLWYRFQLLSAYGTLQASLPPSDRDSDWLQALAGNLPQIVHGVLQQKGSEASVYQRLLENQITSWRVQPADS